MASAKDIEDAQSGISDTASSVFEGTDAPHLQFLRKDRKEINAEIANFFVKYDEYETKD